LTLSGNATIEQSGGMVSMNVSFGSSLFQSANTRCTVVAPEQEGVLIARAFTNIFHDDYVYAGIDY
jgi:hypothetical protein